MWDPRHTCKTICVLNHSDQTTSNDAPPARTKTPRAKPKNPRAPHTFAPTPPIQTCENKVAGTLRRAVAVSRSRHTECAYYIPATDAQNPGAEFCAPTQNPDEFTPLPSAQSATRNPKSAIPPLRHSSFALPPRPYSQS